MKPTFSYIKSTTIVS